ncbi:RcnB family protein [Rhodoferax sp.]|uniref:RcnB family protein n=1 Tax=Rhodoferax sp. TaxID=50421 RepID=UPI00374D05BD
MKSAALVCAIAAASLGFSSLSFAQEYERRGSDARGQHSDQRMTEDHGNGRAEHQPQRNAMRRDGHGASPRGMDQRNAPNDRQFGAHGPQFYRGGHIPAEYRNREYVVDDWRAHRLSQPPRGHHWVQVGPDYVLVAIATGIIAQLVLSQ